MLGGPTAEMYTTAGKILLEDPDVDMLMTIFVPQAITPVNDVARCMVASSEGADKPVVACLVGGESIPEAIHILNKGGVPFYRDPNRAGRALGGLWQYRQLRERPTLTPDARGGRGSLRQQKPCCSKRGRSTARASSTRRPPRKSSRPTAWTCRRPASQPRRTKP